MRHQPAQGTSPHEPFVHIAHQDHRCLIGIESLEQALDLVTPFSRLQAQMGGDHPQHVAVAIDIGVQRTARFPAAEGEVQALLGQDGIAAQHRIAIASLRGIDGRSFDGEETGFLEQQRQHIHLLRAAQRHFLQGQHIGIDFAQDLGDALRRK